MLFLVLLAVILCALLGWVVFSLGIEAVQALIALIAMTVIWHLLRRRTNVTIADDFRSW